MAAIDLRSSVIFIRDGSTSALAGAVNNVSGYPVGTKTMAVDLFTGAVAIGTSFVIGSHLQFYMITAHTETAGNTTSVSFYPGLVLSVADDAVVTVIGNAIYAKIGEGNLTYNEKRNLVYIRDRGFINTVKIGDDEPIDVSIDFTWEFLRGTASVPPTFEEAFKQIGQAASWVTTSVDTCEPYSLDIVLLNIPPCGSDAEKITLPAFRWSDFDHDLKGAKVSVKGSCNVLLATVAHSSP